MIEIIVDNNIVSKKNLLKEINFNFDGFFDNRTFERFVKSVERIIRMDWSYLNYIKKIKEAEHNLTKDVVLNNLKSTDATIEMHHHPLTLYDIVSIVALHNFNNDIEFTSFSLAKEVVKLHYDNLIGLAPMSVTTHQLAHLEVDPKTKRRYVSLTKKQIFGKYEEFTKKYKDGMTLETKQKMLDFERISEDITFKIDQEDLFK